MAAPQRALLLDLDGVVFHHPAAHAVVARRVDTFVERQFVGIDAPQARAINRRLYAAYGHTLLGLRAHFGKPISAATFNRFVYAESMLMEVARLPRTPETQARAREVQRLQDRADDAGTRVSLFTNAPRIWCRFILDVLGLEGLGVIASDDFDPDVVLKPASLSYAAAEGAAGTSDVALVDDVLQNLTAAPPAWRGYLMFNTEARAHVPDGVTPVRSLDDVPVVF